MPNCVSLSFSNTYINLGDAFFQRGLPSKVASPRLIFWNEPLAKQLNLPEEIQDSEHSQEPKKEWMALLAQYFSGNVLFEDSTPVALAYSGHQFGHFNPQLGDGRAHLLGELLDKQHNRYDLQLKGSGQTAFSRRGDGKCALAPALREYIMSEAMFALGVPTSRCLAVVSSGETINRGVGKPGAIVSRIAESHLRVGTFQYFAARRDLVSLSTLFDYTVNRHFPELAKKTLSPTERMVAFLEQALEKQITLVVHWLRVGFIHGVMNTDNTSVCGETIDYGPCAMLGSYHQDAVFSSIDEYGRYAFSKQAEIAQWNMARLADCLLPLLYQTIEITDEDEVEHAQTALRRQLETVLIAFTDKFERAYFAMYADKLGLSGAADNSGMAGKAHQPLIEQLLQLMQEHTVDYTQCFTMFTQFVNAQIKGEAFTLDLPTEFDTWLLQWQAALAENKAEACSKLELKVDEATKLIEAQLIQAHTVMAKNNPVVIPRNHHVEAMLTRCEQVFYDHNNFINGDNQLAWSKVDEIVGEFLTVLRSPYQQLTTTSNYQDAAEDGDQSYQTFCGT